MEKSLRLLVVGAGSTGGYFGGRLVQAGRDVTFLVRPARFAHLQANGLQVISPRSDFTVSPKLVVSEDLHALFDFVLLTVKAFALEAALNDVASAVGPDTTVVPGLNGMKHMDVIASRFGKTAVIGGVCKVSSTADEQGRIVQLTNTQELIYGEMDGSRSARAEQLDTFLQGAGFNARLSGAIEREMWEKWILLASLCGICCLMRGSVGEIEAAPGGASFALRLLEEVVSAATGLGHPPSESFLVHTKKLLTEKGSSWTSSMYRDLQEGKPIEADQIVGDLLKRAEGAGIQTPLLAAAYTQLSIYGNRLTGTSYRRCD